MSVVGIDFGNESCFIAVAKSGGIETIANDYSLRATPSCVAFHDRNRIVGVAASNQRVTNMKNTIVGFKRLLGRKYNDRAVQQEIPYLPYNVVEKPDGSIGIKVRYMNEEQTFSPEQITAMLFSHLKGIAEKELQTVVNDCVISVPSYFTQAERKAVLDAAYIAGLNVLRLFNDTASTALSYGIYKQDLPPPEEKPRNVCFVDCGYAGLQCSIVAFNNGKLKILSAASDGNLGGRDIDRILADHFSAEFVTKYKLDARKNPRAYLRLVTEVEKLKKQMSANSTKLPLNIECFMEDRDVSSSMQRSDMEELCQGLLLRVRDTLIRCLNDSNLALDEIHSIELIGGSTRIPAIKNLIEEIFKQHPSTTLNQDEAVARGCALQCAILSPAIRVKPYSVMDIQNYAISMRYTTPRGMDEMEIFPANHPAPFARQTNLEITRPFEISLFYSGPTTPPDQSFLAKYVIQEVPEGVEKIRVKVRVNIHGLVAVTAVGLQPLTAQQEKAEKNEEKMEVEQPLENGGDTAETEVKEDNIDAPGQTDDKKEKRKIRSVDLDLSLITHGLSDADRAIFVEEEGKMAANDKMEKDRVDVKNSLEEYAYDLRGKLQDERNLSRYVAPADLERLVSTLSQVVDWLYEDGEDCARQIYADKLNELRNFGEPIKNRKVEADVRSAVIQDLAKSIQQSYKIIGQHQNHDERYAHIPNEEIEKAIKETNDVEKWLNDTRTVLDRLNLFDNPPVTVAEIRQKKQTFENYVAPIFNMPKPKVEPPVVEAAAANPEASANGEDAASSPKPEATMDTDG